MLYWFVFQHHAIQRPTLSAGIMSTMLSYNQLLLLCAHMLLCVYISSAIVHAIAGIYHQHLITVPTDLEYAHAVLHRTITVLSTIDEGHSMPLRAYA